MITPDIKDTHTVYNKIEICNVSCPELILMYCVIPLIFVSNIDYLCHMLTFFIFIVNERSYYLINY